VNQAEKGIPKSKQNKTKASGKSGKKTMIRELETKSKSNSEGKKLYL